MNEGDKRFVSQIQNVVSLLNLHVQYQESADVANFLRKLRMRMELLAETFLLAAGVAEPGVRIDATIEPILKIVARIYDPEGKNSCRLSIVDVKIGQAQLATLCQIFAELLSNIYTRPRRENAPNRVDVEIFPNAAGQVVMSVRDADRAAGDEATPLDLLTSRMISELARSLNGEAIFDGENIYDACLKFPSSSLR